MRRIIKALNTPFAALIVWVVVIGAASNHFLTDHIDVSTIGAETGDVLTYNSPRGWKPETPLNLTGVSSNQVLFAKGDSISSSADFTYDGTILQVKKSVNPRIQSYRTGSGAAYMEVLNDSQTWQWLVNNTEMRIEPNVANGLITIRNLANDVLLTVNTSNGAIVTSSNATFRVENRTGTSTAIAGYASDGTMANVTLGAGLALTSGTLSTDQTAAETTYDNSTSGLTATDVKTAIDETVGAIPDNITDLTISSTVDFDNNRITGVANAEVDADAVNKEQLDSLGTIVSDLHSLDFQVVADGDTLVLTNEKTLVLMDGSLSDIDAYIDGSAVSSGSLIYIKFGNTSTDVTLNRDATNDPGNFIAESSLSTASTLNLAGDGMTTLLKYGATWYQLH